MSLILHLIDVTLYLIVKYFLISVILWLIFKYFNKKLRILLKRTISSEGKAVLITGCDSGFGNRLAQRLCQMGFKVYATVLSSANEEIQELKTNPLFADKVIVLQMDVTNDSEVTEAFDYVKRDLESSGHVLWAVVNNAGLALPFPLEWGTHNTFNQVFDVNLFGAVRVTKTFLPLLRTSKGRLINVVSILGRISFKLLGAYCMSKYSMITFTDTLRRELKCFGIKVCSIEEGSFKTDLTEQTTILKHIDAIWKQTPKSTKKISTSNKYNSSLYIKKLLFVYYNLFPREDNIDIAVNDIIDAISNRCPKLSYKPMSLSSKLIFFFLIRLPSGVTEWLLRFGEDLLISGDG